MPIFQKIAQKLTQLIDRFIRRRPAYAYARKRKPTPDQRRFPRI